MSTFTYTQHITFNYPFHYRYMPNLNRSNDLLLGSEFNRYYKLSNDKETIELPVILKPITDTIGDIKNKDVVVNIGTVDFPTIQRSFDPVLKKWFKDNNSFNILRIKTTKDDIYYGGKGLVLDSSYKTLLLITLLYNQETRSYTGVNIYVSPSVFIEQKSFIEKGILNKLIPFYLSYGVTIGSTSLSPKIIVEDPSALFEIHPNTPTPSTCSDDALNELLLENISDIDDIIDA